MYSIREYGRMIADHGRMDAYAKALRQVVRPDSVVLDIGSGTGIFALLACRFGARRVYAIEPNDAIEVAREIAFANGYGNRIKFIQNRSTEITLPERADLIVSDLRGVLPTFQRHLTSIIDARQRLLAPGGVLIPRQDTLWGALANAPDLYNQHLAGWEDNGHGLKVEAARQIVLNTWRKARAVPTQLLAEPQCWATLDYSTLQSPHVDGQLVWTATQSGTAHGIILWFDSILAEGVCLSNDPAAPERIYGNAFFPWLRPVAMDVGDSVSVNLTAHHVGEDYIWCWETRVLKESQAEKVKAHFKQSTFFGAPLSPARLRARAAHHVPKINEDGEIDRFILDLMDGRSSLGDIAKELFGHFARRFPNWQDALTRVADVAQKYDRPSTTDDS